MHRIQLERPSPRWRESFLEAVARSRRLHGRYAQPPADEASYANWLRRLRKPSHVGHLVIHEDDGLVGTINVSEIVRGCFHSAYLGYYIFEPFAARGYMTAGLRLAITHAFGELRVHRLEANVQPENAASLALVKRLGFTYEGYSPRYLKLAGRWRDHERWALLKEDWRGLRC